MSELYEVVGQPEPKDPVLVVGLEGWVDAGFGAVGAVRHLLRSIDSSLVATFDADVLVDHRSRRPVLHLVGGVNTRLTWPSIELRHGRDLDGRHLLVLAGAEPDVRWQAFAHDVVDLMGQLGAPLAIVLGAYPAPVPHTRDVRLATSATSAELADRAGSVNSTLDVPAGVGAAIENRCREVGIDAVGLWAQVPHYVGAMGYPLASAALLDAVARLGGLRIDAGPLREAGQALRERLDALVAENPEHVEMVRTLEQGHDDEAAGGGPGWVGDVPSADELAAEVERFLRDMQPGGES